MSKGNPIKYKPFPHQWLPLGARINTTLCCEVRPSVSTSKATEPEDNVKSIQGKEKGLGNLNSFML